mmetsp:Transcript_21836/g.37716  ORF Transcript_21836/g.37716 Transcript_21836/m.37716 type:complete len:262 (+) Transcript_21836:169-954(+)
MPSRGRSIRSIVGGAVLVNLALYSRGRSLIAARVTGVVIRGTSRRATAAITIATVAATLRFRRVSGRRSRRSIASSSSGGSIATSVSALPTISAVPITGGSVTAVATIVSGGKGFIGAGVIVVIRLHCVSTAPGLFLRGSAAVVPGAGYPRSRRDSTTTASCWLGRSSTGVFVRFFSFLFLFFLLFGSLSSSRFLLHRRNLALGRVVQPAVRTLLEDRDETLRHDLEVSTLGLLGHHLLHEHNQLVAFFGPRRELLRHLSQ